MWVVKIYPVAEQFFAHVDFFFKGAAKKLGLPMAAPEISSSHLPFLFILLSIAFKSTGGRSSHFSVLSTKPQASLNSVIKFITLQIY